MQSFLSVTTKIVAFADQSVNSNPRLKTVDWLRDISHSSVQNAKSDPYTVPANSSVLVFDGTQSTTIDGTTAFSLTLSTLEGSRYRFTYTGGTAPGFRTARGLTLDTFDVTFAVNSNATATVTTTGSFASVQVGDEVFIPHTTTGDSANVISAINAGYWLVLGKASSTVITLVRLAGEAFQAIAETVTLTDDSQFRAYSTTGVQVGYSVDITSGFAVSARKNYEIVAVTDTFVEVISTTPLADETGILPSGGMTFYSACKQFLYVEASQDCVVRVNGDTGNYQRVSPADASNPDMPGQYLRRGPTWSLTIVNQTTSPANVLVVHAE
jgi:hypothetical protein